MATVYFTNNAASGTNSLADVYSRASDGDVIVPDPALGTPVVITNSVTLRRADSSGAVTISGDIVFKLSSETARLVAYASTNFIGVTFTGSDRSATPSMTRSLIVFTGDATVSSFDRCVFAGTRACGEVGIIARGDAYETTTFLNCAFLGLSGVEDVMSFLVYPAGKARAVNCSFVGILDASINILSKDMVDCKTDATDLVVPPPADWSASTWTPDAWRDWNPHILSGSADARGYNSAGERYDIDGNPRVNGTLGAFETIDAELYWVGKDSQGEEVTEPSLDSAAGWSTDRFAENGFDDSDWTTPSTSALSLYVGKGATFSGAWHPSAPGTLII